MLRSGTYRSISVPTLSSTFHFIFFLLLYLSILNQVKCFRLKQPFNISQLDPNNKRKLFGLATDSPIAKKIRQNNTAITDMKNLFQLFKKFVKIQEQRRSKNSPDACQPPSTDYLKASRFAVQIRQIGKMAETCDSTINAKVAVREEYLDFYEDFRPIREIIQRGNKAVFEAASQISQIPSNEEKSLNWTKGVFRIADWDLKRDGQRCTLERTFGHFINGHWYLRVEMTNAPVEVTLKEGKRQYIYEFVRDDLKTSLKTIHPMYKKNETDRNEKDLIEATTIIEKWSGRVGLSANGDMQLDDLSALKESLKDNTIAVDLASDAITASNIAILSLPMWMSLIPISFIADLNSLAMILYIVFTDIFSVLPLLIKGIELIESTTKREEIFVYQLGDEKLLQMEIFCASCGGDDNFRKWGICFIIISILGICIGISLEIWAERYMKKRRKLRDEKLGKCNEDIIEGPFGMAGLQFTKSSVLGRADTNDKKNSLILLLCDVEQQKSCSKLNCFQKRPPKRES